MSLSAEDKVKILLAVLKNTDASPDLQTTAEELGIDKRATARFRFKSIVEADGTYLLTSDNKVVLKSATGTTVKQGKKRGRPKKATTSDTEPATKKTRKTTGQDEDDGTGGAEGQVEYSEVA